MRFKDFSDFPAVIIGTGPSLTAEQLEHVYWARKSDKCRVFGVNNAIMSVACLDVHMACNIEWWDHYHADPGVIASHADKWTWDKCTADRYAINHIPGRWGDSFSTDPAFIHYGHSSGFQIMNLAYHYGIRTMILIGYDMRYLPGYDRRQRKPGAGRHYFGEYPEKLQHWPKVGPNGEFTGLLRVFRTIDRDALNLRIINCTPGSALDFFENAELKDIL
jgi:hypothetical protein